MNNWKDAIVLVSYTSTKDSDGFPVDVETRTEPIPANLKVSLELKKNILKSWVIMQNLLSN